MMFTRRHKMDPLVLEMREARRKMFVYKLTKSYANRKHTILWAMVFCTLAFMFISPFRGVQIASFYAVGSSTLWAMVHRVRIL